METGHRRLWMDEIRAHHKETMRNHGLLSIYWEPSETRAQDFVHPQCETLLYLLGLGDPRPSEVHYSGLVAQNDMRESRILILRETTNNSAYSSFRTSPKALQLCWNAPVIRNLRAYPSKRKEKGAFKVAHQLSHQP